MSKIGIIAAMDSEAQILINNMQNLQKETIAKTIFYCGKIGKNEIILMQCGIGKVCAACATQALISKFSPDYIINTGCAGALNSNLKVGDLVISTSAIEYDLDFREIGFPLGFITSLGISEIKADQSLISKIKSAIDKEMNIMEGLVVSGDKFVSSNSQRDEILKNFPEALCTEMEGAAIAHVCAQNNVPFCILRCMSDTADGNSGVSFAEFSAKAGITSAKILIKMLEE